MGFYSSQSLVADARRHGVEIRRPDIVASGVDADLELLDAGARARGAGGSPPPGCPRAWTVTSRRSARSSAAHPT